MTKAERVRYEMFLRVRDFGHAHRDMFPESSTGGRSFATIARAVAEIESHVAKKRVTAKDGRQEKAGHLARMTTSLGLTLADAIAVGDGANDVAMVQLAGLGVAYRGKPLLAGVADAVLRHADLTALLYLQGYGKSEFAEA